MSTTSKSETVRKSSLTLQQRTQRQWIMAGGALVAFLVIIVAIVVAMGSGSGSSTADVTPTGSSTPAGAQVLEVGAVAGPNGKALLNARDASLTALNVQYLEFGDEAAVPEALAAGTGNAAIVPESAKLKKGQEVIAKLYSVESGGTQGIQVLIAPTDSPLKQDLQTLAKALQSQETLDYLNSVSGLKVTRIK